MKNMTKKLFIAIMTMALLVVTFGTSTFAWFTLGTESKIQNFKVNVQSAQGMEVSLNGKAWKNNITLADMAADVDFKALSTYKEDQPGVVFYDRKGNEVDASSKNVDYFEMTFYVRLTSANKTEADFDYVVLASLTGDELDFTNVDDKWLADLDFGAESKYYEAGGKYEFDALNALKVSFTANDDKKAKFIFSYGSDFNQGEPALDSTAKVYSIIKEYDTETPVLNFVQTQDPTPVDGKDYYLADGNSFYKASAEDFENNEFKSGNTYYELSAYKATTDTALVDGKDYFTFANNEYTKVAAPDVAEIASYYEKAATPTEFDYYVMTADKTRFSYAKTTDTALVDGKDYYTVANGVYTKVATPDVANIATYYERGAANNTAYYEFNTTDGYTAATFGANEDLDSTKTYFEKETKSYDTGATLPEYVANDDLYDELTNATSAQKEKVSILVKNDFQTAEDAVKADGCLNGKAAEADDAYVYAMVTVRVWLEGWDADCINAIYDKQTSFSFVIKAVK